MAKNKNNIQLVKTEDELKNKLSVELAKLEAEMSKVKSELEDTKFLLEYSSDDIYQLRLFLQEKAKWTSLQSMGIIEALKVLDEAEVEAKKHKIAGLMLNNVPIEAIAFYMSNYEGVGSQYAQTFTSIALPIFKVRERLVGLRKQIDVIQADISKIEYAMENNIDVEKATIEMDKESNLTND